MSVDIAKCVVAVHFVPGNVICYIFCSSVLICTAGQVVTLLNDTLAHRGLEQC